MVRALVLLAFLVCSLVPAGRAETLVDLELVLAVDVSGSIDSEETRLQRDGYVAALSSEEVLTAITAGPNGRIALAYVEWAGVAHIRMVVDWRLIDSRAAALDFIEELALSPPVTGRRTSISNAIHYTLPLFKGNGFNGRRKIIDISGDGPNNSGFPIVPTRDRAAADGVGINGLVILNDQPGPLGFPVLEDLDIYYEECVIVGTGAFVLAADGFVDFGRAIRRKLVLEIADLAPRRPLLRPASGYDCLVGERQLRQWLRDNPFDP